MNLKKTGPNGHLPLSENDPARPNEGYFAHVDWVVARADVLGLTVGMLPTWGDKWNKAWGAGPEIFTPENAYAFGWFLGRRYADAAIIWILGGDRVVETDAHRAILQAMAEGLTEGDGGTHLRTLHPPGGHSSSEYFPDAPWLDFHLWHMAGWFDPRTGERQEIGLLELEETTLFTPPVPGQDWVLMRDRA